MKKYIFVSLVVIAALLLTLMPVGTAKANHPLNGTTTYRFVGDFDDQGRFIFWEGDVSGDIEGVIRWWGDPFSFRYTGQASHYDMSWEIVEIVNEEEFLLMAGEDNGTTTARHAKNSNWRTNGIVTVANGAFEEWVGRHVHMSGHFTWTLEGIPYDGSGIFRVN